MSAGNSGGSPIVVDLKRVGRLQQPWVGLFGATVDQVTARLADQELAVHVRRFVRSLALIRYTTIEPAPMSAMFFPNEAEVIFLDGAFNAFGGHFPNREDYFSWVVLHETAHILDHVSGYELSAEFATHVGSSFSNEGGARRYIPGNLEGLQYATTISGSKSVFEDFAESAAIYLSGGAYMRGDFGKVDKARLCACSRLFKTEDRRVE